MNSMLKKEADYDTFFEEIYYKYRSLMFYTARRMLKDTYAAEDAVSEAFIKIAKNLSKLSQLDEKQLSDYVYILTRNTVVDILRKRKCEKISFEGSGEISDAHRVNDLVFRDMSYPKTLQTMCVLSNCKCKKETIKRNRKGGEPRFG